MSVLATVTGPPTGVTITGVAHPLHSSRGLPRRRPPARVWQPQARGRGRSCDPGPPHHHRSAPRSVMATPFTGSPPSDLFLQGRGASRGLDHRRPDGRSVDAIAAGPGCDSTAHLTPSQRWTVIPARISPPQLPDAIVTSQRVYFCIVTRISPSRSSSENDVMSPVRPNASARRASATRMFLSST
jgi:hypothetical protein